ncbi:hypothetical protein BH10BAC3_BH10BAC3_12170 [soil metagenome]
MKKIIYRAKLPTPPFFRRLRKLSVILASVSAVILTAPITLPAIVVTVAGYTAVAASVAGVISQLTVDTDSAFLSWINGDADSYLPPGIDKDLLQ